MADGGVQIISPPSLSINMHMGICVHIKKEHVRREWRIRILPMVIVCLRKLIVHGVCVAKKAKRSYMGVPARSHYRSKNPLYVV